MLEVSYIGGDTYVAGENSHIFNDTDKLSTTRYIEHTSPFDRG
jgi:hypothetical protein